MRLSDNLFFRRLHSFTGTVPLGVFLIFHLYQNSYALSGMAVYDSHVVNLRNLPYLLALETVFIFAPLLYHAFYGLYVWYTGKNNFPQYAYARNWLYSLQRVTGIIAFIFIAYHIYDQRLLPEPSFATVRQSLEAPAVFILYFLGIAATSFHFLNGVWNALVKWGITVGRNSQRAALAACVALGLGLVYVGLKALTGFM